MDTNTQKEQETRSESSCGGIRHLSQGLAQRQRVAMSLLLLAPLPMSPLHPRLHFTIFSIKNSHA